MTRLHVVLTFLLLTLLVPGVTLPIYGVTITGNVEAVLIPEPIQATIYEQSRSILGAVRELWRSGDHLVSFLILVFSIIVPVTKASTLVASLYARSGVVRRRLVKLVDAIGKWSMADVFVVAVFLAFLATRDQGQATSFSATILFQQIDVNMQTQLTSELGPGFYFFLGYCLLSIFWTQVLLRKHRADDSIDPR